MNDSTITTKRKRLIFQSNHRGSKEMDLVMGQFCMRHIEHMSDAELDIYAALTEEEDRDIWNWIVERDTPVDKRYQPIIEKMREYTPLVTQQND